ncbi:hypothetical protein CPB85DRAFT_1438450 [Mucidula mucida]|nr:hypothetical protein CPB85DRAFT_1438450 [Mucidula mucida]
MPFLSHRLLATAIHILAFSRLCFAYYDRDELQRRQVDVGDLKPAYDYIVVGGGQSGLVIANRLSEDSTKTVLVVEYGTFDDTPSQIEPSSATNYARRNLFNVTSVPQPAIGNKRCTVYAAAVVGGGSTINGMLFDRGAAEDYDNWEKLNNTGWGWDGLLPYFKKSTRFNTPTDPAIVAEYNQTWDASVYGTDGPIQVTFPPWVWPTSRIQFQAWNEVGVPTQFEGAAGKSYNAFWVPSNADADVRRSYARNQYLDPAKARTNLELLTSYRVNEVLFSSTSAQKANQEIVLCAGWLHTPHILQRSGVGPKALLEEAGIPVVVDLPGVGSNVQDHPATRVQFTYSQDLEPNAATLRNNETFQQWAQEQWLERRGPLSMTTGNSMATLPLPIINPNFQALIDKANAQIPADYLPTTYTAEDIAGFLAQRELLVASYASTTNGLIEVPFSGGGGTTLCLEKPISRGTVTLNVTDRYAEPIIDFNTGVNPVDTDIFVSVIKFYRKWMAAPSMAQLGPVEEAPGTNVTTDEDIGAWANEGMGTSTAHTCCTAAMMPRDLGGVVSPELLVYGVSGLSVGDISLIPMIPATHTCATVYAISEKAADLIKSRASSLPPGH